jgi:hypothetical protein
MQSHAYAHLLTLTLTPLCKPTSSHSPTLSHTLALILNIVYFTIPLVLLVSWGEGEAWGKGVGVRG